MSRKSKKGNTPDDQPEEGEENPGSPEPHSGEGASGESQAGDPAGKKPDEGKTELPEGGKTHVLPLTDDHARSLEEDTKKPEPTVTLKPGDEGYVEPPKNLGELTGDEPARETQTIGAGDVGRAEDVFGLDESAGGGDQPPSDGQVTATGGEEPPKGGKSQSDRAKEAIAEATLNLMLGMGNAAIMAEGLTRLEALLKMHGDHAGNLEDLMPFLLMLTGRVQAYMGLTGKMMESKLVKAALARVGLDDPVEAQSIRDRATKPVQDAEKTS